MPNRLGLRLAIVLFLASASSLALTQAASAGAPVCRNATAVHALPAEVRIANGCSLPNGWSARRALRVIRASLSTRSMKLRGNWRGQKWLNVALAELNAATGDASAWSRSGTLRLNAAALAVQYRIGRAIRVLHWANQELYEVSKADKRALAAVARHIAAGSYAAHARARDVPESQLARALKDLTEGDDDFARSDMYHAWGRYRRVWQRLGGLL
jgi:hypothetical protein